VEPLSVADLKAMADEFLDEAAAAAKAQAASRRRTTPKAAGKKLAILRYAATDGAGG
jgi:hypothetical protein